MQTDISATPKSLVPEGHLTSLRTPIFHHHGHSEDLDSGLDAGLMETTHPAWFRGTSTTTGWASSTCSTQYVRISDSCTLFCPFWDMMEGRTECHQLDGRDTHATKSTHSCMETGCVHSLTCVGQARAWTLSAPTSLPPYSTSNLTAAMASALGPSACYIPAAGLPGDCTDMEHLEEEWV